MTNQSMTQAVYKNVDNEKDGNENQSVKCNESNLVSSESQPHFEHCKIQVLELISMGNFVNQVHCSVRTLLQSLDFESSVKVIFLQHPSSVTNFLVSRFSLENAQRPGNITYYESHLKLKPKYFGGKANGYQKTLFWAE